jgi:murein DD-endopeptidase MepM/ murein hydrolase activator NlpD
MRSRGRTWQGYSRVVTALIVGTLATVAALNLFFRGDAQLNQRQISELDEYYAGRQALDWAEEADSATPAPPSIQISLTLEHSATVARYLAESGLESDEAQRWAGVFQQVAGTRYLRRDHLLTLYKDPETGELRGLRYDVDLKSSVMLASLGNMVLKASSRPIEYTVKPVQVSFEVRENFKRAAQTHGVPGTIVESLEDAFADRHDLDHLRPGSAVKLIYQEKISRDGNYRLVGDVEAAQIRFGDRTLNAFAFRDEHGRAHLYDEHGQALGPQFLRFPLNFEYISSGFTFHRYHPILHEYRPHVGVDLVAKYGTPVKAIADGRVQTASWCGELGNCVRIDHERGTTSIYGHLSRISPDARPGGFVRMGQVIGWVGSTGLSTGPHLHFALEKQGSYVNPLTQKLGVHHQVSPRMKSLFDNIKMRYEHALAKLPDLGSHFVPSEARKPAISPLGDLYHVELTHPERKSTSHRRVRRQVSSGRHRRVIRTAASMDIPDGAM